MTKVDWNERFEGWNIRFWWAVGFPLAAIWAAFHWNYDALGTSLAALYAILAALFLAGKILKFAAGMIGQLKGKTEPRDRFFALWDQMYEVWSRLEGPVVNPSLVREAMKKSTDEGAAWDTVSWSLIDRVIAIDPAVWVIQPSR